MNYTIKMTIPEHHTYDGILVERKEVEHEVPFATDTTVWYAHHKKWWKRNSAYVLTKGRITGIWATHTIGVIFNGDQHIAEDEFDMLFTDREEALEYCLKKNAHRKIKIYGE